MDTLQPLAPPDVQRRRLPVSWMTIAVFAIVISFIDGFWVTSVHDAVGAVDTSQSPFDRWLRDSTMMLPFFILAVLGATVLAHRWLGQHRRELVKVAGAAVLIIIATTAVSIAQVATNSAAEYKTQTNQLTLGHANHASSIATPSGVVTPTDPNSCTGLCAARHATLVAHVRAVKYASIVLLITNLVVVVWLLAFRGGRLWARQVVPNTTMGLSAF